MIAIVLGMLIVLAITSLVISSKSTQSTQNDAATIQDTARYALNNISHSVKQAGYINFDREDAPAIDADKMTASVMGFDAGSLKATTFGLDHPVKSTNSSDILALRFFGSGMSADSTILNCAGSGVPAITSHNGQKKERSWSIYYVGNDVDDEPALFCKYRGKNRGENRGKNQKSEKFAAQAIARGVESFQVLYGVDTVSSSTQFHSATEIAALDSGIPAAELNQKTHWKKITAIKVAMLIRGAENSRLDSSTGTYNLFGEDYGNRMGASDKGTQIHESDIPESQRNRLRKVVSTTIQLRNPLN